MGNWTVSAWPILASAALKSTLVLGAAWLITYLLRHRSAAARHSVWTASAAALIALPLFSVALPAVRVRLANALLPAEPGIVFHTTAATPNDPRGAAATAHAPANRKRTPGSVTVSNGSATSAAAAAVHTMCRAAAERPRKR